LTNLYLVWAHLAPRDLGCSAARVIDGSIVGLDLPELIIAHRAAAARLLGCIR